MLRPFQDEVIQPILQAKNVILQTATGSGKTEGVLAPCLQRLLGSGGSEALLYVVPTRARHKLVVGSTAFFTQVPHDADALQANYAFKA